MALVLRGLTARLGSHRTLHQALRATSVLSSTVLSQRPVLNGEAASSAIAAAIWYREAAEPTLRVVSLDEMRQHTGTWVCVDGTIYDVTTFARV